MTKVPDPRKEAWARHLRQADALFKQKKFEEAIFELEKALDIDPKDMYARSFLGRLRDQWNKKEQETKAAQEVVATSLEQRMELIPKLLGAADKFVAEKNYQAALREIAKVYRIDPNNYYAQAYSDRIDELMRGEETQKSSPMAEVSPVQMVEESGNSIFYKELLREYWFDGKLTQDELDHLSSVRESFAISDAEHERLSKVVRFEAYVEALHIAWIDGVISETERRTLEFMRNKYEISGDEEARAEGLVQRRRKESPSRQRIIVVDGDKEHVVSLTKVLKKYGYQTLLAPRPEEALNLLASVTPVALVMEVRYEKSEMDGFELYRRARQFPALVRIPVFLTVKISDKDILHAAVRLGIDHVLQKPVDPEFIVAALIGRKAREELLLL